MKHNKKTGNLKWYIALLLMCIAFVTVFSTPTSPLLAGKVTGVDSTIFMVIGKNWAAGHLPYVETWDHKGPMIFLVNAIGYSLTGNHIGIYLIQIISLFITMVLTFKSFSLFQPTRRSLALTTIILLSLTINYESGNLTEEYILPLMAGFYYVLLYYFYKEENGADGRSSLLVAAFIAGLILSFSFLTRLTNAMGVCMGCLVLFVYLLRDKQFKSAVNALLAFLAGFALLTLPIIGYFYAHDALDEMWYASITFNKLNSFASGGRILDGPFYVMYFFMKFIHCFFLLVPVIMLFMKRSHKQAWTWLAIAATPLVWLVPGRLYSHYGMTITLLSAIAIILLLNIRKENPASKFGKTAKYLVIGYALYVVATLAIELPGQISTMRSGPKTYPDVDAWFDQYGIDKDSFVAYNYDWSIYLNRDITPPMRFFFGQDDEIRVPELEPLVLESLQKAKVKWILVGIPIYRKTIKEYVDSNYTLVATGDDCTLYHLNTDTITPPTP